MNNTNINENEQMVIDCDVIFNKDIIVQGTCVMVNTEVIVKKQIDIKDIKIEEFIDEFNALVNKVKFLENIINEKSDTSDESDSSCSC